VVAGGVGCALSQHAVFVLLPVFAVPAGIAMLSIAAEAIGYNRARDLDGEQDPAETKTSPAGYGIPCKSRPLVTSAFASCLHVALLRLVGPELAAAFSDEATAMISACIIAAQAVMVPIALLVGRTADSWRPPARRRALGMSFGSRALCGRRDQGSAPQ
jgi:hypothetical protein